MSTDSPPSPGIPDPPNLPPLIWAGDVPAPEAPASVRATGVDRAFLSDMALKVGYTTSQFTTEGTAQKLHLPVPIVSDLLEELRKEQQIEALGSSGAYGYRYSISQRGRERAARLFEISGYLGPAPVSLEAYTAMVEWQSNRRPHVSPEAVTKALSELQLTPESVTMAGLAAAGERSLFVYGPAGNGKTAICRMLQNVMSWDIWIPHCFVVDNSVVRVFDLASHPVADFETAQPWAIDQRWIRVRPPLIVVGGELTIKDLDLSYSPSLRFYEAPVHIKSNGGILLIDDFGRQRVDPVDLLNRWIIPMEYRIDYLTLNTGQKICVPFRQLLLFATNLNPSDVTDPAFLRRMGYRLHMQPPTPTRYSEIFNRYMQKLGLVPREKLITWVLARYRDENRELRCCEPRDLLDRVRDVCRFRAIPMEVTEELLDVAWTGYFGHQAVARANDV